MILDCGHEPSPHGEHTTGTGHTANNRHICWDCCLREELEALKTATQHNAYLHEEADRRLTLRNWPGGLLARVTESWETSCGGFLRGRNILRFRAVDVHGAKWYGTSPGVGMYARMHRAKS